jgi:glycerol kinase
VCNTAKKLEYALEGSIFVGGAVVQWLRDNMRFFSASPDVEGLAASVESAENVVFVPAFTGLGAPYWDPYASGMILGIQRSTQIGHIARAALESIAFQVADVLQAMERDTQQPLRELRVDGGAAANDMLMQFQADLLQRPVRRPAMLESTALGAAYLAGLAVKFWGSTAEIAMLRGPDVVFQPKASARDMAARQAKWQDAVTRAGGWNKDHVS